MNFYSFIYLYLCYFSLPIFYFFLFSVFCCLFFFWLISSLGKLILLITSWILCSCSLLSSRFILGFRTFHGHKSPLMTLVDLYRGGLAYFQRNCVWLKGQELQLLLILSLKYIIWFVSSVLCSIFAFRQCRKGKGLGNRTLVLSLGVMTPPATPVTELILVFFFFLFTRLCPSLSLLYTHFIITIIYFYQLQSLQCLFYKSH